MTIAALHIGSDHLGYLPMILALAVIVFIGAVAIRTKLERAPRNHEPGAHGALESPTRCLPPGGEGKDGEPKP